jgi:hypothetical protein
MEGDPLKTIFDFFKHLSAMCTACILMIMGLLQWRSDQAQHAAELTASFKGFVESLAGSLIVMAIIAFRAALIVELTPLSGEKKAESNTPHWVAVIAYLAIFFGFVYAVNGFVLGLRNLYSILQANLIVK